MNKKLPENFLLEMKELLKGEFDQYLESFSEAPYQALRVNTKKISVSDFLRISPFHLTPVPWCENGFYYPADEKPAKHPFYFAGLYYLQEPSAMLPAKVLPVFPGDRVLDLCAAPGGKSTELGARLHGSGVLFCNDVSASRALALLKNLSLFGIGNSIVFSETPENLSKRFPEYFDRILIDAPCSGEGMFRKDGSVIRSYIEHGKDFYVSLQKSIVGSAIKMLARGGDLVYSTCTFSPEEDEQIIEYMMEICPELSLSAIERPDNGMAEGFPEVTVSRSEEFRKCVRMFPHRIKGEGHFVAHLHKSGEPGVRVMKHRKNDPHLLPETLSFLSGYPLDLENHFIEKHGDRVYLLPNDTPDLSGLRVLRSGLFLGEEKKNRFEPAVDLLLSLSEKPEKCVSFSPDSDEVLRYLKGETVSVPGTYGKGYLPVCVSNFPLGFSKFANGNLKNEYPKGWRYQ